MTSSLPTILVSCKCDNPENTRQINVENMEAACVSAVEAVKIASNVPESARQCFSSMLRAIMLNRNGGSVALLAVVSQHSVVVSDYQSFDFKLSYLFQHVLELSRMPG